MFWVGMRPQVAQLPEWVGSCVGWLLVLGMNGAGSSGWLQGPLVYVNEGWLGSEGGLFVSWAWALLYVQKRRGDYK